MRYTEICMSEYMKLKWTGDSQFNIIFIVSMQLTRFEKKKIICNMMYARHTFKMREKKRKKIEIENDK